MLYHKATAILASAAMIEGSSPVIDPPDQTVDPLLVERQGAIPLQSIPSPPSLPYLPLSPALLDQRFPYLGRFQGVPGASCGEPLPTDLDEALYYDDCFRAAEGFLNRSRWYGSRGRQTADGRANCIAVWHPAVVDQPGWSVTGRAIWELLQQLLNGCNAGPRYEYVTNWAFLSQDEVGTVALYTWDSADEDWMGDDLPDTR